MQMVSQVMTRNVAFVTPQESVRHAAQIMDDLNVGALPVCDGEKLVGMVTDRDITVRSTSAGFAPDDVTVDDVMSTDVRWCFEDQPLEDLIQQMEEAQIRRVPVVTHDEARRLIGIVSLGDVVTMHSGSEKKQEIAQVVERISFPSEPDRTTQGNTQGKAGGISSGASNTGTANGLAGSDILADRMMPGTELSSTADPSDVVEVTPDDLVNRNSPDNAGLPLQKIKAGQAGSVVHRIENNNGDTTTGESGAPEGIDAAGALSASGGTAGTAGTAGTGVGAKP